MSKLDAVKNLDGHKQYNVNILKNVYPNLRLFVDCLRVRVTYDAHSSFHYYYQCQYLCLCCFGKPRR